MRQKKSEKSFEILISYCKYNKMNNIGIINFTAKQQIT